MESPLRYNASDEYSSSWLKFHLGLSKPSSQRTKPNPQQQQQRKQQQHLNTLGLRLNAAGKIKPTVVHMPSLEHSWKIHYSYKTKALTRSISDDEVKVETPASQRNTREWPRSESGKRSPHDGGKETTRVRSAASGTTLARGKEQRSPRIGAGTPELVTTTPIRLLGVLRSPEHALNWRANNGQQQSPRYFTFPPVTGSRPGATPLVRPQRRFQVSTAPVESRLRSGPEKEDPLTLSRSTSSESLPSAWKYADGKEPTTGTSSNEVTDDPPPNMTAADQSTETSALPTIDEEDATGSETHRSSIISVRISRNNTINNRYNDYNNDDNDNDQRLAGSDELRLRVSDDVDGDSDSLSVYDDDSEEEDWTREQKPSTAHAINQTQLMDNEDINEEENEDDNGDQNGVHNGDQNEDYKGDLNDVHNGDQKEDRNGDQNGEQNEDHNRHQNEDHNRHQNEGHSGDQNGVYSGAQTEVYHGDQNEDHNGDQIEDHNGDQSEGHNEEQNADQNGDLNEDQNWDQNEHLSRNEKEDPRECSVDDYQEIETWTKEVTDFSPTQRTVYPPLTSRDRDSDSPPIPRDIPIVSQSHKTLESLHFTDEQRSILKVLDELRQIPKAGEVENSKEVDVNDIGSPEEFCEGRGQEVSDKGEASRETQERDESDEQKVECNILKETTDENNNVSGTQYENEPTKGSEEIRETSSNETDVEESTKNVESDSLESLEGSLVIDGHSAEANESKTETVEPLMATATELTHVIDPQSDHVTDPQSDHVTDPQSDHVTDPQSDLDSEVHLLTSDLFDDRGQQQNDDSQEELVFADEKLDSFSEETVSLENSIASQEERRSPLRGKAARKRSVRFSQDVPTVYLYLPVTPTDDSDTSDSGFLSP